MTDKETIGTIKQMIADGNLSQGVAEKYFPQLTEDRDDTIRKELINFLQEIMGLSWHLIKKEDYIAWVEKKGEKSLDDVAKEVTKDKNVAISFLKSCGIINENGELADEYRIEQGEQKFEQKFFINDKVVHKATGKIWTIHHYLKDTNSYYVENNDGLLHHYRESELKLVEQKPAKVEPKFKVGDWVIYKRGIVNQIANVKNVTNHSYGYETVDGEYFNDYVSDVKLWTIQDAKDGDVLAYPDDSITLFKYMDENIYMAHVLLVDGHIELNNSCAISNVHPATKEQRDTLFAKMKEAGYEWNTEKKELKKIEQNPAEWSEDDQSNFCELRSFIVETYRAEDASSLITWLESLKDRFTWKPSDEQIKAVKLARAFVVDDFDEHPALSEILIELEEQLKKLKD